jgi:hypothetical protein
MARQTVVSQKAKKKRGPPATGKGTPVMVRLQPPELARLDEWIALQEDAPSRPEALRRLTRSALAHEPVTAATNPAAPAASKRRR